MAKLENHANSPLISTTSGVLSYNDEVLLTTSNVQFNSGTVDSLITEYIYSNNNHTIYIDTLSIDTANNIKLYIGTKSLNDIPNAIPQVVISSKDNQNSKFFFATRAYFPNIYYSLNSGKNIKASISAGTVSNLVFAIWPEIDELNARINTFTPLKI